MHTRRTLSCLSALVVTVLGATLLTGPPASAVVDKDCGDFSSQRAAQIFFLKHGGPGSDPHRLDAEGDGIACESNPAPYYYKKTLPSSGPKTRYVDSTVSLRLNNSKAIRGEKVRLNAAVKPRGVRTLVFQKRSGSRWRAIDRSRTNARGKAKHVVRTPGSKVTFRAVALKRKAGNKMFKADASPKRALRVQRQRLSLALSRSSVAEDVPVVATIEASPVRRTRPVSLQVYRGGRWRELRSGTQNTRGKARLRFSGLPAGAHRLRATTSSWRGAARATSASEMLSVRDVTAPPTPTGLDATSADGVVDLSWDDARAPDLDHYAVYVRTSGSTWGSAGDFYATAATITGLANGTTYWFAVSSVDGAGNESTRSSEVQAVPSGPTD